MNVLQPLCLCALVSLLSSHMFLCHRHTGAKDKTYEELFNQNGCNGTPPMVYGVVWNPLRPADAQRWVHA